MVVALTEADSDSIQRAERSRVTEMNIPRDCRRLSATESSKEEGD